MEFVYTFLNNSCMYTTVYDKWQIKRETSIRLLGIQVILPFIYLLNYLDTNGDIWVLKLKTAKVLVTTDRSHSVWILSQRQISNNGLFVVVVVIRFKWNSGVYTVQQFESKVYSLLWWKCTWNHFTSSF